MESGADGPIFTLKIYKGLRDQDIYPNNMKDKIVIRDTGRDREHIP